MKTECTSHAIEFQRLGRREVIGRFDGGTISSDAGRLLPREVERRTQVLGRLSQCFVDRCKPDLIEHRLEELVKQHVYGIAPGL